MVVKRPKKLPAHLTAGKGGKVSPHAQDGVLKNSLRSSAKSTNYWW